MTKASGPRLSGKIGAFDEEEKCWTIIPDPDRPPPESTPKLPLDLVVGAGFKRERIREDAPIQCTLSSFDDSRVARIHSLEIR